MDQILADIKKIEIQLAALKKAIYLEKLPQSKKIDEFINGGQIDMEKMKEAFGVSAYKIARSHGFKSKVVWSPEKRSSVRIWTLGYDA